MGKLPRLAIFGVGNMGEALLGGMLDKGIVDSGNVIGVEALAERAQSVAERFGIEMTDDQAKAAVDAEIILIAVKPKDVAELLTRCGDLSGKLLISICAGLKLDFFEDLAPGAAVVRVMPNTPALVGQGASAYCVSPSVDAERCIIVEQIFGAVGTVSRLENEGLMDAVTGLSGSGPAYVYLFMEALADGGVACGLPRDLARKLAAQTVLGAAAMARGSQEHTAELKDRVCSPGGTTIEAVSVLEATGFRSAVMEAVAASAQKSAEMGEK